MTGSRDARLSRREVVRDRVVDGVLVAGAAVMGLIAVVMQTRQPGAEPAWVLSVDPVLGVLGCAVLWWRRRFPVALGAALAAATALSETVAGAAIVGLFTVAVHASTRATAAVCATSLASLAVHQFLWPEPTTPPVTVYAVIGLGHAAVVAWGLSLRNRRALVTSLRERAAAAEVEARLRAERSQSEAREALARDMHDALGHRLSLLSVHAGALAYQRDASAEDVAQAAEVVRENAHRALQDLREVIGVLRAPVEELSAPVPEDILELIDEARQAGTPVRLRDEAGVLTGDRSLPATQGRTIYRLVQECLTNVRKHAPGASVVVRIAGRPGEGLTAEIVSTEPASAIASAAAPPRVPPGPGGSGEGLRGLAERARLVDGRLDYGPTDSGGWQVRIRLPWPA